MLVLATEIQQLAKGSGRSEQELAEAADCPYNIRRVGSPRL
jgi:hypothetical protein